MAVTACQDPHETPGTDLGRPPQKQRRRGYPYLVPAPRRNDEAAAANEATRLRRLREDARRPISVNLAEGIALSHKLMRFTGAARKSP